jgi:hypothetical protein
MDDLMLTLVLVQEERVQLVCLGCVKIPIKMYPQYCHIILLTLGTIA